jgi:hypothetical protein
MNGSLGGRGHRGLVGDAPERMVAEDVEQAIRRKQTRYPTEICSRTVLGIYVNSNPGALISDLARLRPYLVEASKLACTFLRVVIFKDERAIVVTGPDDATQELSR